MTYKLQLTIKGSYGRSLEARTEAETVETLLTCSPTPSFHPQPHPTMLSYLSYQAILPMEGTAADCGLGSLRQLAIEEMHLGQFDEANSPVKGFSSQVSPVCAKLTKTSFNFQASLLLDKILILDSSYLKYF